MRKFADGRCPVCRSKLEIARLTCPDCKAEYPIFEPLSPFDYLTEEQTAFLELYLKSRGSLKAVGEQLELSYPTVKKRFDDLLEALGYLEKEDRFQQEMIDMSVYRKSATDSGKASDRIRSKLYENGGVAVISLYDGSPCRIIAENDGKSFSSDKLGITKYTYDVFDVIVDHLKRSSGFRAPKGGARNKADKVGYGHCVPGTVVYQISTEYAGKPLGSSAFDPVFVLAAVLEWAGLARNGRGYLELTPQAL